MSEHPQPDIVSILDDIDNNGRALTSWEIDFLDEMLKKADQGYRFSELQVAKIKQIHARRVS